MKIMISHIYTLLFLVVLLTYHRDAVLASAIERLSNMPYLNKVNQYFLIKFQFNPILLFLFLKFIFHYAGVSTIAKLLKEFSLFL